MPIREHPKTGSILMCDFSSGFKNPEMSKKRPVIVISPKIKARPGLCTVVSLSTTTPYPAMHYHAEINLENKLPPRFKSDGLWVKGDMVNAVGFHRLNFIRRGTKANGNRDYYLSTISDKQLELVRKCVLSAMGISMLTT